MLEHKRLFEEYTAELRVAKDSALEWWNQLLESETKRTGSADEAQRVVGNRWPFGAASHPFVIATFRKYFIACEQLNDRLSVARPDDRPAIAEDESDWEPAESDEGDDLWDIQGPIGPDIVLIEALSGREDDLSEFMELYLFPCIGQIGNRSV
jgi:hypothetical protein